MRGARLRYRLEMPLTCELDRASITWAPLSHDPGVSLFSTLIVWMRDLLGVSDDLESWRQRV